jgi:hypothetical protein
MQWYPTTNIFMSLVSLLLIVKLIIKFFNSSTLSFEQFCKKERFVNLKHSNLVFFAKE